MNFLRIVIVCASIVSCAEAVAEPDKPVFAPAKPGPVGSILCEHFDGVNGGQVGDLTNNPVYPLKPTYSELLKNFELPLTEDEHFGLSVRGYITAPTTGNYTFWICADDAGELYLSSDETPANRKKICACPSWTEPRKWDQFPEQKSQPVALQSGKRYYIEALQKQEAGGAHVAVGWELPDGKKELPIPGSRLAPAGVAKAKPPMKVTVKLNGAPAATTPGQHKFPGDASVDISGTQQWKMSYLVQLPNDYDKSRDRKPLFIFLCGNSHQGDDLGGILNEGPAQFYNDHPNLKEYWPMVGLFPQPPGDKRWDSPGMAEAVVGLIDEIIKKYRVDPDRVYLSGLSMGGKGTWLVAEAAPDRFAAIAPISAVAVRPDKAGDLLRYTPTWIICGSDDGGFTDGSKQMAEVIKAAGGNIQLTVYPHEGHGVWGRYYPEPKFYDWLLKHKRDRATAARAAATTQPAR